LHKINQAFYVSAWILFRYQACEKVMIERTVKWINAT
jgi:hypothetical protein